jgi:hypothetical protein
MRSGAISRLHLRSLSLFAIALLLMLAGCGDKSAEIVGKWKVTSDTSELVWDFAPGGTVTSGDIRGRYSFGSDRRMKLQTPFATFVYQVDVTGDKMTWKDPKGTITELARVK